MKTLKITESCLVKGQHAEAGTVLQNVENSTASDLMMNGRAIEITANQEILIHRDPEPEHRDLAAEAPRRGRPPKPQ